ncbi:voltage-gated monoatomic cation channel TMEM109 [Anas platyrhynchos]|uniref:voltage-gated monoatomic cation channel TMEM109 n=1 Tax=Anas platyrhynchos TaxID=8839 RepID=UPI003AF27FBA
MAGPPRSASASRFRFRSRCSPGAGDGGRHRGEPGPAGGRAAAAALGPLTGGGGGGGGPGELRAPPVPSTDPLWRLGHAAWATLEGWLGPEPLRLLAEGLAAVLWLVSSAISAGLAVLSTVAGDILSACGLGGAGLVRGAALAPGEVQRVLLWGLAALAGARLLRRLLGVLLAPLRRALRCLKLCCFLAAFLRVAAAEGSGPTAQAAMLLGLWGLYLLLGGGGEHPPGPEARLEAAVRSLEWKVEELCRWHRWGGAQNREEE